MTEYGYFEIDGKVYHTDGQPLQCAPWNEEPLETVDPVTATAVPSVVTDHWSIRH